MKLGLWYEDYHTMTDKSFEMLLTKVQNKIKESNHPIACHLPILKKFIHKILFIRSLKFYILENKLDTLFV